jgi:hypothetical protein
LISAACERGAAVTGETDSLELNDRQKTRLLSLGLEPDRPVTPPDENEQRGDLLCDILRCPLPADVSEHGAVPPGVGKPCPGFRTVAGPPLGELLQDPQTEVAVLRRVKEYAKSLGCNAGSEVEKDVFLAVYFAAIAAAMVFHNELITEHFARDLTQFLDSFAQAAWMPTDLKDLFSSGQQAISNAGLEG